MAQFSEVQFTPVNTAASGNTTLVPAQAAGVKIRVVAFGIVAAGAVVANIQSGAGGTSLTGPMTMATGIQIGGDFSPTGLFETAPATLLNLNLGGAVQVSGWICWVAVS